MQDRCELFNNLKLNWRKNDTIRDERIEDIETIESCRQGRLYEITLEAWRKNYERMIKGQLQEMFANLDHFKALLEELSNESVQCDSECDSVCVTELCDAAENRHCAKEAVSCSPGCVLDANN